MIIKDGGFNIKIMDNYLEIVPEFEVVYPNYTLFKYVKTGSYLLNEYTRSGQLNPGEYFKIVSHPICEKAVYVFPDYSDLYMYLLKKLYSTNVRVFSVGENKKFL